jgi:16S rRNA processing protein RimM
MNRSQPDRPERRPSGRVQIYTHRNRQVRIPEGYMAVGYIAGVHGLRGEVRVELHTDFPERFAPGAVLWLGPELEELRVATARPHQGQMLVRFDSVTDRTQAEALRNRWLLIQDEHAEALEPDTYFVHDIVGATVQTTTGRVLGTVTEVLFTGANEVYVVAIPGEAPRELLLPAIADVVQEVDLAAGVITVELLPGLLDE